MSSIEENPSRLDRKTELMKTVLLLLLCGRSLLLGAPLIDESVPELRLVSGKVLHEAQAKGYLSRSVLVRHSEGVETVSYEEFPVEYREQLVLKRPPPDTKVKASKPRPSVVVPRKQPRDETPLTTRPTLSITTSRVGSTVTTVELYNEADTPAEVRCSTILAETNLGTVLTGRQWVIAEVSDMVSNSLGTKQVIAQHASSTLNVVFDPLPPGAYITQISLKTLIK